MGYSGERVFGVRACLFGVVCGVGRCVVGEVGNGDGVMRRVARRPGNYNVGATTG